MEPKINLLAVSAGAFAYFSLGAIWFAPRVLGNRWRELSGLPPDHSDDKKKFLRGLTLSALCCFLTTYILAHFLQYAGGTTVTTALQGSAWICFGFVGLTQLQDFLFNKESPRPVRHQCRIPDRRDFASERGVGCVAGVKAGRHGEGVMGKKHDDSGNWQEPELPSGLDPNTEAGLALHLAKKHGLHAINLLLFDLSPEVLQLLPENICRTHRVMPVKITATPVGKPSLILAVADPSDRDAIKVVIKHLAGAFTLNLVVAPHHQFEEIFERYFGRQ